MKLNQIENIIDPIILERGEVYRENGHILSINEIEPLVYHAEVEGNDLYDVEIQLGSRGEVIYTLCECPYDKGPICKHAAAVLLEIRDESSKEKVVSAPKNKSAPKKNIADQLSKLSKDELIKLLVNFSNEIKEVEQALSLKFINVDNKEGLNQYKKVIRSSIKQNSDRHGFVAYRNVPYAVAGAEKVMEKAEDALESGHHLRAVEISFCIMHEMGDLMQSCDDSDGYVGGLIQVCLNVVQNTASQFESNSFMDRPALFQLLLKEALHPNLEGWNEWQLSLMESAIYLITNASEKDLWSNLIERLESHERNKSSYSSYFSEEAAKLRYQVIQKLEGDSQALKFLQAHLDITAFRKMAIEDEIKNLQFDKALELAEQGEQKDTIKGHLGLVNQWKKCRYEIYELTHQVEHQIKLAEEFAVSGDHSYYLRLKELYSKDEWEAAYEGFLFKLETNCDRNWNTASLYTRVLIEEKETLRLLKYVHKHKQTLLDYYPHLIGEHAEEVFLLFIQIISEETARSSNRNEYRKVCGIIRHLIKAGGGVHAKEIIEQLCLTYRNRPALMDELQKIKLI
ncbi:SWIM zinc finger family protein [Paenibacillus sp. LHD-38]|uniref:SWIM zinc finger family protein n=1 Tax=Paenibacillus sp. LHD-38 TaxID=3072143 RepID=UPI00280CA4BD|nr:SWIM zinc finger family protein [Paenibacillus sp. LHD-38]MDQ8735035.1 SWIM zinc finger family protein [Paenibacillus sp. LHD-38]